ncbi:fatty acyl-AMP ligase [Streptomyces sp. NPDC018031]|uniref:fatty acyl-AMP ligase n=1 Tax=Streptomyces sp. NPDC018031 TaxID=3365033 RepID=UPI0037B85537
MTSAPPCPGPLLTDQLRHWAEHRPHHRAFTFVDFPDPASAGLHRTLGWRSLDARARGVAHRLTALAAPGERAALLLPQGLDYAAAFLGCLYAGVIAVPLFGPRLPGHEGRLAAILADCEPACLLTDTATAPAVEEFAARQDLPVPPVVRVDRAGEAPAGAAAPVRPGPGPGDIAYLQYTSGSTRSPAGVMITHANVVANARQAIEAVGADAGTSTAVGWLPLFHDMGLVLSIAAPVVGGFASVLMDPAAFLAEPARWLRLLGAYPGTLSAAPNFAYDYCVARTGAEHREGLRLERVRVLLNGSEPVRAATVDRFRAAFAGHGLAPEALCPAYGLAEATVFVTADSRLAPPTTVHCDAVALAEGRVVEVAAGAGRATTALVACGTPVGQQVRVVDPVTGAARAPGQVGEIVLRGPNVGAGYWKRSGRSEQVFGVRLAGEEGGWLRTGDLGALSDGRLLVTGRLKDVIIVDGRNHYPQDVEETVQSVVPAVRRDRLAAFCVPGPEGMDERLVVVAEHRRGAPPTEEEAHAAARAARAAVSARHGLRLDAMLLTPPGSVPRTTSGKVSRAGCRAGFLAGEFGGASRPAQAGSDSVPGSGPGCATPAGRHPAGHLSPGRGAPGPGALRPGDRRPTDAEAATR